MHGGTAPEHQSRADHADHAALLDGSGSQRGLIGLMFATASVAEGAFAFIWGISADRVGIRAPLLIQAAFGAMCLIAFATVQVFVLLYPLRFVLAALAPLSIRLPRSPWWSGTGTPSGNGYRLVLCSPVVRDQHRLDRQRCACSGVGIPLGISCRGGDECCGRRPCFLRRREGREVHAPRGPIRIRAVEVTRLPRPALADSGDGGGVWRGGVSSRPIFLRRS